MFRLLIAVVLFGSMCAVTTSAADDDKKEEKKRGGFGGKMDASATFKRMDADKDGKVTKDEFEKGFGGFGAFGGRGGKGGKGGGSPGKGKGGDGKGGGAMTGRLFERFDADKDGKLTEDEFKNGMENNPLGRFGGFGGSGFGKGKDGKGGGFPGKGGFGRKKDNDVKPAKPEELPPPREKPKTNSHA